MITTSDSSVVVTDPHTADVYIPVLSECHTTVNHTPSPGPLFSCYYIHLSWVAEPSNWYLSSRAITVLTFLPFTGSSLLQTKKKKSGFPLSDLCAWYLCEIHQLKLCASLCLCLYWYTHNIPCVAERGHDVSALYSKLHYWIPWWKEELLYILCPNSTVIIWLLITWIFFFYWQRYAWIFSHKWVLPQAFLDWNSAQRGWLCSTGRPRHKALSFGRPEKPNGQAFIWWSIQRTSKWSFCLLSSTPFNGSWH